MSGKDLGHWAEYAPGTGWLERYRHCLVCGLIRRGKGYKSLIHKGGKP